MNDVTTFETTKKLLEAGFPKSNDWGVQYFVSETNGLNRYKIGDEVLGNGKSDTIRACSALDILKELGITFNIGYDHISEIWYCQRAGWGDSWFVHNESPAEAAAELYLKFKNII